MCLATPLRGGFKRIRFPPPPPSMTHNARGCSAVSTPDCRPSGAVNRPLSRQSRIGGSSSLSCRSYADRVDLEFSAEVWFWRGPSPYHFVTVPDDESAQLQATSALVSYGWGMIPVEARIGSTRWTTSLFPKDGGYVVPLKDLVRNAERVDVGDTVTVRLAVDV